MGSIRTTRNKYPSVLDTALGLHTLFNSYRDPVELMSLLPFSMRLLRLQELLLLTVARCHLSLEENATTSMRKMMLEAVGAKGKLPQDESL